MKLRWKKLLAAPFVFIAAIVVLFEDWLWDDLARMAAAIGRLPLLRQIESLISGLPPYPSLAIFAAPSLLLIPVKLVALWFIAHQHASLGLLTIVAAKVVGTALVARIYYLTESKLLRIGWFARLHERYVAFKARVYEVIRASELYQTIHRHSQELRAWGKRFLSNRRSFWRKRWEAAVKLRRRSP